MHADRDLDALLGQRVALRFRVDERFHRDAVGVLSADGDALVVAARRGPVRVDRAAVVAVRAVPPAPPRRSGLAAVVRLEGLCADAWPAVHELVMGEWRLRAAGGFTGRANSALVVGEPDRPIPDALDAVRAFAAGHGIPARVQVPFGSPWDRVISAAGWVLEVGHEAGAEVAVMVADLAALAERHTIGVAAPAEPDGVPLDAPDRARAPAAGGEMYLSGVSGSPNPSQVHLDVLDRPDARWWGLGGTADPSPAQRHVLDPDGPPRTAFPLATDPDGRPLGRLRAALADDHLHLSQLDVVPRARRRGLATALTAAAAGWGREHGARWAVLQVALHNTVARAVYDRQGFVEHHRYRYLVPPTSLS